MAMRRRGVAETVAELVQFVRITASRLGAKLSAELSVVAQEDEAGADSVELWGHAPLLYRPLPDSEALTVELGEERIVLATKERRWQVALEAGDVVVRALGDGAAHVKLKPDGTVEVKAERIQLGESASEYVALAGLVKQAIDQAITKHNHGANGAAGGAYMPPFTGASTPAAQKTRAE